MIACSSRLRFEPRRLSRSIPVLLLALVLGSADARAQGIENAPEIFSRRENVPEAECHFGYRAHALDLDRDGIQDLAISALRSGFSAGKLGEVWFFRGPQFESIDYLPDPNPQSLGGFGSDIVHGDLDNDGVLDVIIGAAFKDLGDQFDTGEVFLYRGFPLASVKVLRAVSPQPLARFGWDLAIGDLDADGFDDLVIGAPFDQSRGRVAGRIHIFFGPDQTRTEILELDSPSLRGSLGEAVLVADLNADGFDDVIAGAARQDSLGVTKAGSVLIAFGPDLDRRQELVSALPEEGSLFGNFLAQGDMTGDGNIDLLVSSYDHSVNGIEGAGLVEVFPGPHFTNPFVLQSPNPQPNAHFGTYIDTGEIDGDDRTDLVIGARDDTQGQNRFEGAAYVTLGRDLSTSERLLDPTPVVRAAFGHVTLIEDVNDDGRGDVIVTGHLDRPDGIPEQGEFHVFDFSTRSPFVVYGRGTPGSGAIVPSLNGNGLLRPGTQSEITLSNGVGGAAGLLLVGASRASRPLNPDLQEAVGSLSLYAPLFLQGNPGIPGAGSITWPVDLSPHPWLVGISLKLQGILLDPGARLGLSASPGLSITIQP